MLCVIGEKVMTNEEMEKTIHFILEQQSHFAANIQKLEEGQARIIEDVARLTDATLANTAMIGKLINMVDRLAEAQAQTDKRLSETILRLDRLTERLDEVSGRLDEVSGRLDAFISVVEKYIAEGRNGKNRS